MAIAAAPAPELSVIIPTYRRPRELSLVLRGLRDQTISAAAFEVIVVDDGTDQTGAVVAEVIREFGGSLAVAHCFLPHSGNRAAIRRAGVARARATRLLFLDGDMVPARDFLERHLKATDASDTVSLGRRLKLLPFDLGEAPLEPGLPLADFLASLPGLDDERAYVWDRLAGRRLAGNAWIQVYSHNLCLWRSAYEDVGGFDDAFSERWGVEDIELGYRLEQSGRQIVCDPGAVAFHLHHEESARQNEDLQHNLELFYRKHTNWDVELFLYEGRIWSRPYLRLREALARGEHLLRRTDLDPSALLPFQRVVAVGVTDARLLEAPGLRCVVATEPVRCKAAQLPLLGTRLPFAPGAFDAAVVSDRLRRLDSGLFELVAREAARIADRLLVVDERGLIADAPEQGIVRATLAGAAEAHVYRPAKKVVISFAPEAYEGTIEQANVMGLAAALLSRGVQVRLRDNLAEEAKPRLDRSFYHVGDTARRALLESLYDHAHDYFTDVPNISTEPDTGGRSRGSSQLWANCRFVNGERDYLAVAARYDAVLCRREWERRLIGDGRPAGNLPLGVDAERLGRHVRPAAEGTPWGVIWASHDLDRQCGLEVVVAAFQTAFPDDPSVRLTLFLPAEPAPRRHLELNRVLGDYERARVKRARDLALAHFSATLERARRDVRIEIRVGNPSDVELWEALAQSHCLIDTDPSLALSPVTLAAVALGRVVMRTEGREWAGLLPEALCIPLRHRLESRLLAGSSGEAFSPSAPASSHLRFGRVVEESSLVERLVELRQGPRVLDGAQELAAQFREEHDWQRVAEQLLPHL